MQRVTGTEVPKPAPVCLPCKSRHRKCDWNGEICSQCKSAGIECLPQPTLKFRYHEKQKALTQASPSFWRPCPLPAAPIRFYDETQDLRAIYEDTYALSQSAKDTPIRESPDQWDQEAVPCTADDNIDGGYVVSVDQAVFTPQDHSPPDIQPLTPTEALLVRHFTERMAQWTDIADPFRTFEFAVSRSALTDPIIRSAICAFSARHFYRCQDGEDVDGQSLCYQNQCLNLLIPSMSGCQQVTASVLTAVALLRQNEEMDEQDNRFHLVGASRILNSVPEFASLGGIAEAACWLCLREDIYVSLTTQTPITTNIDCFVDSASVQRKDDQSWASLSIVNLALLLSRAFQEPMSPLALETSEAELSQWDASKPDSYQPIFFRLRSRTERRFFPDVWMLAPYHAVGLQYYHIAQIVLNAVKPRDASKPYDSIPDTRARIKQIRHHLYMVVGLALSNERAENTWFTARHTLSVWGSYFDNVDDQSAILDFLENWRRRSGWKTSVLIDSLRRQWAENSTDDD